MNNNDNNNKSHFITYSDKKKKKEHPRDVYVVPVLQFAFGFYG